MTEQKRHKRRALIVRRQAFRDGRTQRESKRSADPDDLDEITDDEGALTDLLD
jgi:hypothetical protein